MSRAIFSVIISILCSVFASAQTDTTFRIYSASDNFPSRITEITMLSNNRIAMLKQLSEGFQLVITDIDGSPLYQRSLDTSAALKITSGVFLIDDGKQVIIAANATSDYYSYFAVFSVDTTLDHIYLVDTVRLNKDNSAYLNIMKFNSYKHLWEGFAAVKKDDTSLVDKNCYIALDTNFRIKKFSTVNTGLPSAKHIIEFEWIENVQRYLISTFGGPTILVNEDFEAVFSDILRINGEYPVTLKSCFYEDGQTVCLGYWVFAGPFQIVISHLNITQDSISFSGPIDISNSNYNINIGGTTHMRKDGNGNFIVSGVNDYGGNEPNTIGVVKFTPEFEPIWSTSFQNGGIFFTWDSEIDQNNNVIIVGEGRNLLGQGSQNGFLLKVNADGSLTSATISSPENTEYDLILFPNPTTQKLNISTSHTAVPSQIIVFTSTGEVVQQIYRPQFINGKYSFDLSGDISSGTYFVEFILQDGRKTVRKIAVN